MKKRLFSVLLVLMLVLSFSLVMAVPVGADKPNNDGCTTIQDGTLVDTKGNAISVGYDQWGYNYQAHLFNGYYGNAGRPEVPVTEGTWLVMKWSDTWLSNKSCDGDLYLDRHYGYDTYRGSGAWVTNHQSGSYVDEEDGKTYKWNYFVKIVSVPEDAYQDIMGYDDDGDPIYGWYTADGTLIGSVIWGAHARILQVYNDQGTGEHGIEYLSPAGPGFGKW